MTTALEIAESRLAAAEDELASMTAIVADCQTIVDALRGRVDADAPSPEANGRPTRPRVPATAPPPPVSSTPDAAALIARALAGGPLLLAALVERVGMSQPPISARLRQHSGADVPSRERYFERTAAGWVLTQVGRDVFLGNG